MWENLFYWHCHGIFITNVKLWMKFLTVEERRTLTHTTGQAAKLILEQEKR